MLGFTFLQSRYTAFLFSWWILETRQGENDGYTCGRINAIWWNVKINLPKLVDMYGYKLPTNLQNFTQKDLTEAKILSKVLRRLLYFESPCTRYCVTVYCRQSSLKEIEIVQLVSFPFALFAREDRFVPFYYTDCGSAWVNGFRLLWHRTGI